MEMEDELRKCIQNNLLEVHYQPIVDMMTGSVESLEALCRWFHPIRGPIKPCKFIPLAEEVGLIGELGRRVLITVLRQIHKWTNEFGYDACPQVSVNLSSIQLMDDGLFNNILKVLGEKPEYAKKLKFEITESLILSNPELAKKRLGQLAEMGSKLCIDDFGTGYSSLNYLHNYPYHVLKIDRSFVTPINVDPKVESLVNNVINLSHDLGLEIIAEGVENLDQMSKLIDLGCHLGQGYLFAGAMDAKKATALIANGSKYNVALPYDVVCDMKKNIKLNYNLV